MTKRAVVMILVAAVLTKGAAAWALPKVCGNQAALGSWALDSCPQLKDDGVAPDETAGDGIYTAAVSLSATTLLEYKILPSGMWDGGELKEAGTCPFDGGSMRNDTQNIQVPNPDVRQPTLFYFDSRVLSDSSYAPAPANHSGGDSVMLEAPTGACPTWVAVGDFQNLVGPNATAISLTPLRPGVLVGRLTATKSLAAGWGWKVVQQSPGVAREYGPSGWAYAPCTTPYATVSAAVSPGDFVYFLFYTHSGRLQTLTTNTPLDGFNLDGAATCAPPPDLAAAAPPIDLGGQAVDLAAADASSGDSSDGATSHARPGIHCDCQIGRAASSEKPPWLSGLAMLLLASGVCWQRRHRRTALPRTDTARQG